MIKVISISINEDVLKLLDDEAEKENRSRSNFLVGLFQTHIKKKISSEVKENFFEL